jgi:hypothetical protein
VSLSLIPPFAVPLIMAFHAICIAHTRRWVNAHTQPPGFISARSGSIWSRRSRDALFDARLLHVIKRSISGQEEPGARYDAYKLDYGCYVDLLARQKNQRISYTILKRLTKKLARRSRSTLTIFRYPCRMSGQFCTNRISINTESGHGLVPVSHNDGGSKVRVRSG